MNFFSRSRVFVFLLVVLLLGTFLVPLSATQKIVRDMGQSVDFEDGFVLFAPMNSLTTYLIDCDGNIQHTWLSSYLPGESVYMVEDGAILRTAKLKISGGGAGGGIQKISWEGSLIWDFSYYTDDYLHHHDIEPLPNGNVLLLAWEYMTKDEAVAAGKNPNLIPGNVLYIDHIIEVQPTGPTTGDIVWEWHAWDHLIQDFDAEQDNYGVVADHPELIDFNFGASYEDWLHLNSIDYNAEFDQILVSSRNFNEIWVIDHSTTTAEAAGHTGGNSGKGGDLLYRWGNPRAYRAGDIYDQKFFGQHDATWIVSGCPGEGNILVFNNGLFRLYDLYSSVDEIVPPVDSSGIYYLEPGSAYGPKYPIWIYTASNPLNFYANYISGAQRLPDGNTLICDGPEGRFFEVTPEMNTVWEYVNTFPSPTLNNVFKVQYVPPEDPQVEEPDLDCVGSLEWQKVQAGRKVIGSFEVQNIGSDESFLNWKVASYPEWGNWTFAPDSGENLMPEDGKVTIDVIVIAPGKQSADFEGYVTVVNQEDPDDFDVVPVVLKTSRTMTFISFLLDFFIDHPNIFPLIQFFIQQLF